MNIRFDILAWLLVPLAVTLVALAFVAWRARPKGPADAHDGVAGMARFRDAMSKPLPERRGRRGEVHGPARDGSGDSPGQGAA